MLQEMHFVKLDIVKTSLFDFLDFFNDRNIGQISCKAKTNSIHTSQIGKVEGSRIKSKQISKAIIKR